jgi:hypothetical protein
MPFRAAFESKDGVNIGVGFSFQLHPHDAGEGFFASSLGEKNIGSLTDSA